MAVIHDMQQLPKPRVTPESVAKFAQRKAINATLEGHDGKAVWQNTESALLRLCKGCRDAASVRFYNAVRKCREWQAARWWCML